MHDLAAARFLTNSTLNSKGWIQGYIMLFQAKKMIFSLSFLRFYAPTFYLAIAPTPLPDHSNVFKNYYWG